MGSSASNKDKELLKDEGLKHPLKSDIKSVGLSQFFYAADERPDNVSTGVTDSIVNAPNQDTHTQDTDAQVAPINTKGS